MTRDRLLILSDLCLFVCKTGIRILTSEVIMENKWDKVGLKSTSSHRWHVVAIVAMIIIFQSSALIYLDHSTHDLSKSNVTRDSYRELGLRLISSSLESEGIGCGSPEGPHIIRPSVNLGHRPQVEMAGTSMAQFNCLSSLLTNWPDFFLLEVCSECQEPANYWYPDLFQPLPIKEQAPETHGFCSKSPAII